MSIWRMFSGLIILLAFMSPAYGLGIGEGTSASMNGEGQAGGAVIATDNWAVSTATSTGQVTLGQPMYVEDSTGKHAEVMLDVVNGTIISYRAQFSPRQGNVPASEAVSAKQMVSIRDADKITAQAKAWNAADDLASVDIQVGRVGSRGAEYRGETDSKATANSAFARADGSLKGSLLGLVMAGHLIDQARDSDGDRVDCDLLTQARSAGSSNTITGRAAFNVDDDWGGKIQAAINASEDGDLIRVATGTYRENLAVDKSLTVKGAGAMSTVVDGGHRGSVVTVGLLDPGVSVALYGMSLTNGLGYINPDYYYMNEGGGIWNNGTLAVERCTISGSGDSSSTTLGGGIYNRGVLFIKDSEIKNNRAFEGDGGGLYNDDGGKATVERSSLVDNFAELGGAIVNHGDLVVRGSRISDNRAIIVGVGGGIANTGTATISNSEISGNSVTGVFGYASGGGIWNRGTITVKSCRISGNKAYSWDENGMGGGIDNWGTASVIDSIVSDNQAFYGGGIANIGSLLVTGSRITGNSANITGGGIYSNNGTISVIRSTVWFNRPNDIVSLP